MCSPRTPPKSELLHLRLFHISCDHAMYRMTLSMPLRGEAQTSVSPRSILFGLQGVSNPQLPALQPSGFAFDGVRDRLLKCRHLLALGVTLKAASCQSR